VREQDGESLYWCDFLWNKSYVLVDGDVRPCCVAQAPVVGNLFRERFDRLWNNENYRTMRRRLVAKDPVPACRGCLHVREVKDGARIAELLQGRALPARDAAPLPVALDPQAKAGSSRTSAPPVLEWEAVPGARSYVVQFSLDRGSVLFSTDSDRSPAVHKSRYEVPVWAWRQAPVGRPIYWRVLAKVDGAERLVTEGTIAADA
jgi:radical SAM protein with 4Fe4S-binding SPASM domain